MRMQPGVTSMTTSGAYLFAAAGDTIYKIKIETMKVEGQTNLPRPQFQPGLGGGGGNDQGLRRNGGGGLGGGGATRGGATDAPASANGTNK